MSDLNTVIIGLSGGVDSAVAALLLQQQGYRTTGIFMKNWEETDNSGNCSAAVDYHDAYSVAQTLNLPFQAISFADLYWDQVFLPFLDDYRSGVTPNPDIVCNREIKFKAFLDYAITCGATYIATGHYARSRQENGSWRLLKGCDPNKDQSYFLYTLNQNQLARVIFPVGELLKNEVRRLAAAAGLINHNKKDSTGICFIGERPFRKFLANYLPPQPGALITPEGEILGSHEGLMYYTLGQRHGLGLGGRRGDSGEPWYVVAKDVANNTLIVARGHDHPLLYSTELSAAQISWVAGNAPSLPLHCCAKTRYRQADQKCLLMVSATNPEQLRVIFDVPQRALTPGQAVVFYQDDECLGGGIITTTTPQRRLFNN